MLRCTIGLGKFLVKTVIFFKHNSVILTPVPSQSRANAELRTAKELKHLARCKA